MKNPKYLILLACCTFLLGIGALLWGSHNQLVRIEKEVIRPENLAGRIHVRSIHFTLLNPLVTMLPYWTVRYSETPTEIHYISPSVSVNMFGSVVEWAGKEVGFSLESKGYIKK
jgi:hypothetical protein